MGEARHCVHEPILLFNLRPLALQLVFRLNQLVFFRQLGVDFRQLPSNSVDPRNVFDPIDPPALHRRALQPGVRIQKNGFPGRRAQLIFRERRRVFRPVNGLALPVHQLGGHGGFGKEMPVIAVGGQKADLKAAFPQRCIRQAEAFRHFVKGIDVGKTQRAKGQSPQKHAGRRPRVPPAFGNAAFAENNHPGGQQKRYHPSHGQKIQPSVGIIRLQRRRARRGPEGLMVHIVGQHAADQQRRRNQHPIPPAVKGPVLSPPQLQRGKQAEQRREHLRHII